MAAIAGVATAVLAAVAACGSKHAAPSSVPSEPASASSPVGAVAPRADDIDQVERVSSEIELAAGQGASLNALIAQATSLLGPATLVDPAHDDEREAIWAAVRDVDGACAQLRLALEDGQTTVSHGTSRRVEPVTYGACADAAAGLARGDRFAAAWINLPPVHDERDVIARYAPLLGAPSLRAQQGGQVRLVWAEKDARRCFALKATLVDGAFAIDATAVDVGMPWFDACGAWADGRPTEVWATTAGSPARYARLTGDGAPLRVAAAEELMREAIAAHQRAGELTRDQLIARLGPPRVEFDGAVAWAVDDGARCVSMWWRRDDERAFIPVELAWPDEPQDRDACVGIARGDRRSAAITNLAPWLEHRALPRDQELAWLLAALGKPTRADDEPGGETWIWAQPEGSQCYAIELTYVASSGKRSIYRGVYDPSDSRFARCTPGR